MVNEIEDGRKRVLEIIAGILIAPHPTTVENPRDRPSPQTESLVASAVQAAEPNMRGIKRAFANSAGDKR